MPITSIIQQPASAALKAAYRPIVFIASATSTDGKLQPPFVACDVYIEGIYYKTLIRTAPEAITPTGSTYLFDISDALQEYLQPDIADVNNNIILGAPNMSAQVYCKFRASQFDADGFTVEEPVIPIQATRFTPATPGDGVQSNTFFVINAALQHEDNQDLATHLNAFKQGAWADLAFPLTHRDKYYFQNGSSDHYPFIYAGDCLSVDIVLNYRLRGEQTWRTAGGLDLQPCNALAFTKTQTVNKIDIALTSTLAATDQVLVRYKLQSGSVWTNVGYFTTSAISFTVNTAGTYDLQVIRFCGCCTSSAPAADTFTIATVVNVAWRPISPFCVQVQTPPVYIKLDLRNKQVADTWFPNQTSPYQHNNDETYDVYALFYSDAQLLNPVTINQSISVYLKKTTSSGGITSEMLVSYTVTPNATEALLGTVTTLETITPYNPQTAQPSGIGTTTTTTYAPYPSALLVQGNTGQRGFATLEQYNTANGAPTGLTKPNAPTDPDYVAPSADPVTCPAGPDFTTFSYGYHLNIAKVEIAISGTYLYAPTVSDSGPGGYNYLLPLARNTPMSLSIKVHTLDTNNTSGVIKVNVNWIDASGATQSKTFDVPDNIETLLPQQFQNVTVVNISNY